MPMPTGALISLMRALADQTSPSQPHSPILRQALGFVSALPSPLCAARRVQPSTSRALHPPSAARPSPLHASAHALRPPPAAPWTAALADARLRAATSMAPTGTPVPCLSPPPPSPQPPGRLTWPRARVSFSADLLEALQTTQPPNETGGALERREGASSDPTAIRHPPGAPHQPKLQAGSALFQKVSFPSRTAASVRRARDCFCCHCICCCRPPCPAARLAGLRAVPALLRPPPGQPGPALAAKRSDLRSHQQSIQTAVILLLAKCNVEKRVWL